MNALEQVRLADELGFDQVWGVEHHFLEEYSHSSAPELFLTACAMQTKNIRVGHGIVVCVPQFNHPVRIAEARRRRWTSSPAAASKFGTGRSATWTELGGFRADPDDTKKTWDEMVAHASRRCGRRSASATRAARSRCRSARSCPSPTRSRTRRCGSRSPAPAPRFDAADRGIGSLGLTFGGFAEQEKKIAEYRRRIKYCDPVGEFVNEQVNTVNFLYCHEDADDGASRRASGSPARSTTSPRSSSPRVRRTRRAPTRTSACSRRCAAKPTSSPEAPASPRASPSAIRTASSRSSRSGSRSASTASTSFSTPSRPFRRRRSSTACVSSPKR